MKSMKIEDIKCIHCGLNVFADINDGSREYFVKLAEKNIEIRVANAEQKAAARIRELEEQLARAHAAVERLLHSRPVKKPSKRKPKPKSVARPEPSLVAKVPSHLL